MATGTHERQDATILTRQLDKIGTTGDAGFNGANKISGRVLHANDAWQLSQRAIVSTFMSTTLRPGML